MVTIRELSFFNTDHRVRPHVNLEIIKVVAVRNTEGGQKSNLSKLDLLYNSSVQSSDLLEFDPVKIPFR